MRPALTLLFCVSLQAQIPVWIDTDPSVAPGGHEVDDGFALIQAFHSPEISVRGISLVFGNAPLDRAVAIANELLPLIAPGLQAFPGAASAGQLGRRTPASEALASALGAQRLSILAIGPVTNIATVLKNHPELAARMDRIVAVAGRRPGQHFTSGPKQTSPFRDFNFEMDPAAFQVLLESKVPLILAPWEISSKIWLRSADVARFKAASPALRYMYRPASDWLNLWKRNFGADGFNPFDTLAIAAVTTPRLIQCEKLPVEIRSLPDDTGAGVSKPYLLAGADLTAARTAQYCFAAKPAFKGVLMRRLLAR